MNDVGFQPGEECFVEFAGIQEGKIVEYYPNRSRYKISHIVGWEITLPARDVFSTKDKLLLSLIDVIDSKIKALEDKKNEYKLMFDVVE